MSIFARFTDDERFWCELQLDRSKQRITGAKVLYEGNPVMNPTFKSLEVVTRLLLNYTSMGTARPVTQRKCYDRWMVALKADRATTIHVKSSLAFYELVPKRLRSIAAKAVTEYPLPRGICPRIMLAPWPERVPRVEKRIRPLVPVHNGMCKTCDNLVNLDIMRGEFFVCDGLACADCNVATCKECLNRSGGRCPGCARRFDAADLAMLS